ncbi:MAG: sterol desaturase/sphingolipid hydroxylase (fatty acid hydroxylase superfamily), partial [Bradymonadia bacterium]
MLKRLITYGIFPLTFLSALAFATWSIGAEINPGLVLASVTAVVIAILLVAERVNPEFTEWNRPRGDVGTDLLHGVVSNLALPKVLEIGLLALLLNFGIEEGTGFGVWPNEWPLGLQVALALIVGQFGEYWAHRSLHEVPFLWRFHAVHHSPERLYFLNAARFHPVDTTFLFVVGLLPFLVLGAGKDVMLLTMIWITVHGLFQHCNVHLRLGPFNYVFSMAELHRWHHSLNLEEANRNYGNN